MGWHRSGSPPWWGMFKTLSKAGIVKLGSFLRQEAAMLYLGLAIVCGLVPSILQRCSP